MDPEFKQILSNQRDKIIHKLKELEDKIASLAKEREDLNEALQHIVSLLKSQEATDTTKEFDWLNAGEPQEKPSVANLGFRDAVRTVLFDYPDGLSSSQLRQELKKRGYVYDASTPFSVRVSNETRRMEKQGMIARRGNRKLLTEKGRQMAAEVRHVR